MDASPRAKSYKLIQKNDVKIIRPAFCDISETRRICRYSADRTRAFEYGIHFNASALAAFFNVDAFDSAAVPPRSALSCCRCL